MEHTERVQQEAIRRWMQRYERVESDLVEWKRQYDIQQRRACDAEAERDALRNEIAADFRAREELVAKLVEALDGIKSLLGPEGEYAICKADGTKLWLGDDMIVGGAFEKADTALARVKGE